MKSALPMLRVLGVMAVVCSPLGATQVPDRSSPLAQKEHRHPDLRIPTLLERADRIAGGRTFGEGLESLHVSPQNAYLDVRSGRWGTLLLAEPLIPGTGEGNSLTWDQLGIAPPPDDAGYADAASRALVSYLAGHASQLAIDPTELAQPRVGVHDGGNVIQISVARAFGGVPVRDSDLTAVVNHGNLVLFGANNWATISVSTTPDVPEARAVQTLANHVVPFSPDGYRRKSQLVIVPLGRGYRLAWALSPRFSGDRGTWEALVDAHSGELLSFVDTNEYESARRAVGGVYPVSNDNVPPDGVEQPGSPMPFADVASGGNNHVTDTGGNLAACASGDIATSLAGPFVQMSDTCGAIGETSPGDIDLGAGPGTDCAVPAGHSAGDSHASRTGFYELNKIKEQARGQLPGNTWLGQPLVANMNISDVCNAFWDHLTVNFFRSGGGCNNTGEIAAIFDHEWGHGLDDNDVNGNIASPGEATADIYMTLRLKTSCAGRGFFQAQLCGGYGDPCTPASGCNGVRDLDFAHHVSGLPHDIAWINSHCPVAGSLGPCGHEVHCEGEIPGEALWDLFNRDLPSVFGLSGDTALEVAVRDSYIGMGLVGNWYQCSQGSGGCPASSGYMNYLAADDDDGNIADGTPHMQAIFQAFDRHGIACSTPTVQNTGCAGAPTSAPTVVGAAEDRGTRLSWTPVPGAVKYRVFRTEGPLGCNFGKALLGETFGTSFVDSGLQNGRSYFYGVMPVGLSSTCLGPMSSCTSVTPVAGGSLSIDATSASLAITSGDGDPFLDNCETATATFTVANNGSVDETNVRVAAVQPLSHPAMPILGSSAPTPSLASCATAPASFSFRAVDMAPDDLVRFRVDVTSDQLFPAVRSQVLRFSGTEGDAQFNASRTFDFEAGPEGWTLVSGTFNRNNLPPGGAGGAGTFYYASSVFLNNHCDEIRSPVVSLTPTSTLSLLDNFDIEAFSTGWYDRANVARLNDASGARSVVVPSSGRLYNASGPNGPCGMTNDQGWAGTAFSWAPSGWTAAALGSASVAGQPIRIDIKYGTDSVVNGFGFRFDQATLTDFNLKVADGQSDTCAAGNAAPIAVPDSSTSGTLGLVTVPVLANDSDPNGDCMRITQVSAPTHGTAFINRVGCPNQDTVSYAPNLSCGNPCSDSFQYTVSDGQGGTATATVTIAQTPVQLQELSVE